MILLKTFFKRPLPDDFTESSMMSSGGEDSEGDGDGSWSHYEDEDDDGIDEHGEMVSVSARQLLKAEPNSDSEQ